MRLRRSLLAGLCCVWSTTALALGPGIDGGGASDEARVAELERRLQVLEDRLGSADAGTPPVLQTPTGASLTLGGYVETYYQWNFNNPDNFITNFRGFDNRHNLFTIQNAVLDVQGTLGPVSAHLAVQWGATGETYYLGEPVWRATSGAGASGPEVWKFLQQASLGAVVPVGRGLTAEAGIFLSPIGPESFPIKDQWSWSRSNLFLALPFYHTGLRLSYPLVEGLTVTLHGYNGWNSVVDNNEELSLAAQVTYTPGEWLSATFLYFAGVERAQGAAEGRAWRHLFDGYVVVAPTRWLGISLQLDGGFEPNTFGLAGWAAGALSVRVQPIPRLFLVARADYFREWIPGASTPIFWAGAAWVSSQTATIDFRPWATLSLRLEYRHDQAERPLYFAGTVQTDATGAFVPDATSQDTLTLGATAWF